MKKKKNPNIENFIIFFKNRNLNFKNKKLLYIEMSTLFSIYGEKKIIYKNHFHQCCISLVISNPACSKHSCQSYPLDLPKRPWIRSEQFLTGFVEDYSV